MSPEDEFTATGRPPVPDPRGRAAFRTELPRLLTEFNARHPGLAASIVSNGVYVGSTEPPVAATELLSREVFLNQSGQWPAGDAIFKTLVGLLQHAPVTGVAGTGPMPSSSCRLQEPILIAAGVHTVRGFLDDVVRQLPGLVWVLTFDSAQADYGLKLGVVCPDGLSLGTSISQQR